MWKNKIISDQSTLRNSILLKQQDNMFQNTNYFKRLHGSQKKIKKIISYSNFSKTLKAKYLNNSSSPTISNHNDAKVNESLTFNFGQQSKQNLSKQDRTNEMLLCQLEENEKLQMQLYKSSQIIKYFKQSHQQCQQKINSLNQEIQGFQELQKLQKIEDNQIYGLIDDLQTKGRQVINAQMKQSDFWKKSYRKLLKFMNKHINDGEQMIQQYKTLEENEKNIKNQLVLMQRKYENDRNIHKNNFQNREKLLKGQEKLKDEKNSLMKSHHKMNETYRWIIQSCEQKFQKSQKIIKKLMLELENKQKCIDQLNNKIKNIQLKEVQRESQLNIAKMENKSLQKLIQNSQQNQKQTQHEISRINQQLKQKIEQIRSNKNTMMIKQEEMCRTIQRMSKEDENNRKDLHETIKQINKENEMLKMSNDNILNDYTRICEKNKQYESLLSERNISQGLVLEKERKKLTQENQKLKNKEIQYLLRIQVLEQEINYLKGREKDQQQSLIDLEAIWKQQTLDYERNIEEKQKKAEIYREIIEQKEIEISNKTSSFEEMREDMLTVLQQLRSKEVELQQIKVYSESISKSSKSREIKNEENNFDMIWKSKTEKLGFSDCNKHKSEDFSSLTIFEANSSEEKQEILDHVEGNQNPLNEQELAYHNRHKNKFSLQALKNKIQKQSQYSNHKYKRGYYGDN